VWCGDSQGQEAEEVGRAAETAKLAYFARSLAVSVINADMAVPSKLIKRARKRHP
jgi:hypothetical protein